MQRPKLTCSDSRLNGMILNRSLRVDVQIVDFSFEDELPTGEIVSCYFYRGNFTFMKF